MMAGLIDVLYSGLGIPAVRTVQNLAAGVSPKWRDRARGERKAVKTVRLLDDEGPRLWMHAASMGEFEQLVPVAAYLKEHQPDLIIIASVFSPSGYEHARRSPLVNTAIYLPLDGIISMKRLVNAVRPDLVVIDRYDLWRNLCRELRKRCIPLALINATFPSAARNPFLKAWMAETYRCCSLITAATAKDAEQISALTGRPGIQHLHDTRMDRIMQRLAVPDEGMIQYRDNNMTTLIVGSSWPADEDLVIEAAQRISKPGLRLIIVPHEPTEDALQRIEAKLPCTRWSSSTPDTPGHLVVDQMGILLSLYTIGDAAFVGGGFGGGVHSVTEAAGCGLPTACGPRIERSRDAETLQANGLLTMIHGTEDLHQWLNNIVMAANERLRISTATRQFMSDRTGSSAVIGERLHRMLLQQIHLSRG